MLLVFPHLVNLPLDKFQGVLTRALQVIFLRDLLNVVLVDISVTIQLSLYIIDQVCQICLKPIA